MPNQRRSWPELSQSDDDTFGSSVSQYFSSQRPSSTVKSAREETLQRIRGLIRRNFGSSMSVQRYGSTACGIDSGTSDLDLIIIDSDRQSGFPARESADLSRLPKSYDMVWLADLLRSKSFTHVSAIPSASVPIVKFYDPRTAINIDINCNAQLGLFNTQLLRSYCDLYPPLRAMIYFIKRWAENRDINDSSGQGPTGQRSLSSHCYSLMAVAYLQMRRVLPNLQRSDALRGVDDSVFWFKQGKWRIQCDVRIGTAPRFRATELSLADALYGWFQYFGYEYDYGDDVLSPEQGGVFPYDSLINITPSSLPGAPRLNRSLLMVQDPFLLSKNVAGSCEGSIVEDFQKHCKFTASYIGKGHLNAKHLLRTVNFIR